MELSFCVFLNLYYGSYAGSWAMKLNYCISIFFGACLIGTPIFVITFYNWNWDKLSDEEFEEKWGAPYEGLKKTSRWDLLHPCIFVSRRVIFAYLSIFMPNSLMF